LLLAKTRFGYTYAVLLAGAGFITLATQSKHQYADVGPLVFLYLIGALVFALAIGVETYFQNERWPRIAVLGTLIVTAVGIVLTAIAPLPDGPLALDAHGVPVLDPMPGILRLLTLLPNIVGGGALILGALFSAYVFMPKKRVLGYSLNEGQSGDSMLFNLMIGPIAILVNFLASLPGAFVALMRGKLHSRVPATILIAIGSILIAGIDFGVKDGATAVFEASKLIGIVLIFIGFLVSIEAFREIRIPFTSITLSRAREEPVSEPS
jgi:hypothetical protein